MVSPLLWKGRLGGVVNGGTGQGSAHPCLLAPALPRLGEKPQRPVGESQHVSRPGGEPRQAEWVSRAHSCPRGLCPLQPAGPWPGPIRGGWTAPVPARPCDGVGARAQSRTVLNQDLRPAPVPPSAALGSSEGPRRGDCGGQTGRCPPQPQPDEVASWLRARGQGLCAQFLWPWEKFQMCPPPPPALTEPRGCRSLGLRGGCQRWSWSAGRHGGRGHGPCSFVPT